MAPNSQPPKSSLNAEQLAKLRAEAQAPLRGLRQFFYIAFAASALLGAVIFVTQLLAGADPQKTGFNILVQLGVFGLMLGLWRIDRDRSTR